MYQYSFYFLYEQKIQLTDRPVQDVFLLYELNATRHHRCGNETKSDGLVLRKSALVKLQIFLTQQLLSNFASSLLVQIAIVFGS
jgi:hypothetical protein